MTRPASPPVKSRKQKPELSPAAGSPPRQPAWLFHLPILLAALGLLGLFSTEIADTDSWWHLKTGQYIVQHRSLPVPDPFAFTTDLNPPAYKGEEQVRRFNLTHEWLAQAGMYAVYSLGGLGAVILVRALLLAGLCGLAGLLAARRSNDFYLGIAASLAAASLMINFTVDRPAVFTFFMAAVFVAVLEYRCFLWVLPPLALVWANCHSGFFMGWVVLLAYCVGTIQVGPQRPTREDRRRLWLVTVCTIAVSGLNPNGFGIISTLFRYRQSAMTANLIEWHAPYLWGPPHAFDILLYATVAVLIFSWRRVRWSDWTLFAAFGAASLLAFRNMPFIGFLGPVLIASYFPFRFRWPRVTGWLIAPLLAAALVVGVARGQFFQLRAAMWKFPVGAANYLLQNHITGRLFNTWEDGGYLIWSAWPQQRVFIDGRALSESANRDYRQILYNFGSDVGRVIGPRAELLHRYGVQAVVMNTFEYVTGAAYPLALALAANTDWQLVYDDPHSLVFLRDPHPNDPALPAKIQRVLDHMDTECQAYIDHDPRMPMCARTMADYWIQARTRDRAFRMLSLYLSHVRERDVEAERVFQQLLGGAR